MNFQDLLTQFHNWILSYPPMTILLIVSIIIFIASIVESLPIVGMFFPSESITILAGILSYEGFVNIWVLILVVYLGILIGDVLGYKIGKKLGVDYIETHKKRLKIKEEKYQYIKESIDNNLLKLLFIGRSNGFTRWIVPFVAGANKIDFKKFIFINMITASFWSPAFLFGGYFFGSVFETYGKYLGVVVLIIAFISFIIYKLKVKSYKVS